MYASTYNVETSTDCLVVTNYPYSRLIEIKPRVVIPREEFFLSDLFVTIAQPIKINHPYGTRRYEPHQLVEDQLVTTPHIHTVHTEPRHLVVVCNH